MPTIISMIVTLIIVMIIFIAVCVVLSPDVRALSCLFEVCLSSVSLLVVDHFIDCLSLWFALNSAVLCQFMRYRRAVLSLALAHYGQKKTRQGCATRLWNPNNTFAH